MTEEGWDLVISQCNNALHIENSTNPGLHKFLDEDEMQNLNKESSLWKPMDTDMATQLIVNQLKSEFDIACDSDDLVFHMKERVVLNTCFSGLLGDVQGEELNVTDIDAVADNASAVSFPLSVGQDVASADSGDISRGYMRAWFGKN